ncbi:H-2 class I histocompatibility antigen, K-D alpha chain-like [Mugil cephalus]|uniref:H-2 class I histocompatibility antigen, K-D alpha chain-like n=1 Tax=Mugil cephalus TaxID=48193 RepID=UPI001FB63ADD|nr:H-2 class I histocompatibility antigen, K-D alpha chain-like [Mugil cephalus]
MFIYVFVVFLLVVQTVNGDQPDVEMFSESFNQDTEMVLACRARGFNTSGIELHIKKNRCDLLTKEDGVKTSGIYQQGNTYWREDYIIISKSEMSNYSCEVIHAESRFHVEKVWDPDSDGPGRIISSRPRVFLSVDNEVQAKITLTCLAEGFYPRNITLNIKRNGNILTREDGVDSSGVCPREDNTFQRRDHIIISKSDRSDYSCEVIHAASDSHEEKVWDHHLPPDTDDKDGDSWLKSAIIAAVIVVLVLVLVPVLFLVLVLYLRSDLGDRRGRYSDVPQDVEAPDSESNL